MTDREYIGLRNIVRILKDSGAINTLSPEHRLEVAKWEALLERERRRREKTGPDPRQEVKL